MRSIALLVLVLAAAPRSAAAQSTSAQAEALFRRGRQLVAQGKLAEGCTAFEASQAVEPMVTTQINLADCREKNRQLATAWGLYVDVQRQLRGRTDEASRRIAKVAGKRAAHLEPRLSHLTIKAEATAGLEVTRGGDKVAPASWNQSLPIDGGSYEIAARAPGHVDWSLTIKIDAEGDARTVAIPALTRRAEPVARAADPVTRRADPVARAADPTASPARTEPAAHAAAPARTAPPQRPSRVPAIATLGAGTLAVAGSLVLGGLAQRTYRDAQAVCGGDHACDDPAQAARASSLAHDARTRAGWATGVGVAGVAAVGVGVWLLVRAPAAERDRRSRIAGRGDPDGSAGGAGVRPRGIDRRVQLAPHADRDAVGLVAWGTF